MGLFGTVHLTSQTHRQEVLNCLLRNPVTRDLAPMMHAVYSPKSTIFGIGTKSEAGLQQGDSFASAAFTEVIHPDLKILHEQVATHGGQAIGYSDDIYVIGRPEEIFPAIFAFKERLFQRTNLVLRVDKCEAYAQDPQFLRDFYATEEGAAYSEFSIGALNDVNVDNAYHGDGVGMLICGVPFGDPRYVNEILSNKVAAIESDLKKTTQLLSSGRNLKQLGISLTLSCYQSRFDFWLQLIDPVITLPFAKKIDEILLQAWQILTDQPGVIDPITTLRLQTRRANRGAGLRSRVSIIDCCFTGTLVKVLNSLPDRTIAGRVVKGFNKTLATKLLGKDDFGATGVRFDTFTDGQSVIGTQFLQSFVRLRTSIDNPNEGILGSDNIECLGMDAKGVGELEHPQKMFTAVVDTFLYNNLNKTIMELDHEDPRRVAWMNCFDTTCAFIGCYPTSNNCKSSLNLPDMLLDTMWAVWGGLKIPLIRDFEGEPYGPENKPLDPYGYLIMSMKCPGDDWRIRHDDFKHKLFDLMKQSGLKFRCEVLHLFTPFLSAAPLIAPNNENGNPHGNGIQPGHGSARAHILSVPETVSHAIIPDFAQTGKGLLELKTINLCKSHYLDLPLDMRDTRGAACLRRAEKINGEYILNARNADQKYNNTPPGFEGPIYKRLMQLNENNGGETKSLVCGALGEWSNDLRNLVMELVEEIAKKTWQQSGFLNVDRAKSVLWQSVVKDLGVVGFKGACTLINNRFTNNGAGKGVYQSLQKSRTTFNIDHARWGRARDAYNSRMWDHRSNINNNRMVFGSL